MSDSLLAGVRADTQSSHLHAQTADRTCRASQPVVQSAQTPDPARSLAAWQPSLPMQALRSQHTAAPWIPG